MAGGNISINISFEEGVASGVFANQIGGGGFVSCDVERPGASALVNPLAMKWRPCVIVRAVRFHQVGVSGDVIEPIETRRTAFGGAVGDEMIRAGLLVGAESCDEVAIAGDVIQSVETRRAAFGRAMFDKVIGAGVAIGPKGSIRSP